MLKKSLHANRVLSDKERKNLSILEIIRKSGPVSRTDISRLTEYNIVTVSNYINHYISKGLVVEGELDESTGGRKPVLVELNPDAAYVIGLGLNMFSIVGIIVDLRTNVVYEIKKQKAPLNSEEMIERLIEICRELIEKSGIDKSKLVGIGVGVPGIIDETGRSIRWPGALGTKDLSVCMSIKDIFEKEFGLPTYVENDANAAMLGEKWMGLEQDVNNVIYFFSGVGCGIMIEGNIYRGASGAAGELGVYNSDDKNKEFLLHSGPQLGRWEMDLGMSESIKKYVTEYEQTSLREMIDKEGDFVPIRAIIDAARKGDALALRVIEEAGYLFGRKISFLVNLLNPEVVIIGGGIEVCGAPLLDSVKDAVKDWTIEETGSAVRVIPSAFGENAVALGVIGIVVREIFTQA